MFPIFRKLRTSKLRQFKREIINLRRAVRYLEERLDEENAWIVRIARERDEANNRLKTRIRFLEEQLQSQQGINLALSKELRRRKELH